jgi:hypothetical protein
MTAQSGYIYGVLQGGVFTSVPVVGRLMPQFLLKPNNDESSSLEFEALDSSVALEVAGKHGFRSGDMWSEGVYLCTIRRAGEAAGGGYWIVSQRGAEV